MEEECRESGDRVSMCMRERERAQERDCVCVFVCVHAWVEGHSQSPQPTLFPLPLELMSQDWWSPVSVWVRESERARVCVR